MKLALFFLKKTMTIFCLCQSSSSASEWTQSVTISKKKTKHEFIYFRHCSVEPEIQTGISDGTLTQSLNGAMKFMCLMSQFFSEQLCVRQ